MRGGKKPSPGEKTFWPQKRSFWERGGRINAPEGEGTLIRKAKSCQKLQDLEKKATELIGKWIFLEMSDARNIQLKTFSLAQEERDIYDFV